jgi:predicted DNA-binding transcriptional regulator AlpA
VTGNAAPLGEHGRRGLIGAREAARMLGISERLLWSLRVSGQLPCVRIPGRRCVRYDPADLEAWIDAHKSDRR